MPRTTHTWNFNSDAELDTWFKQDPVNEDVMSNGLKAVDIKNNCKALRTK